MDRRVKPGDDGRLLSPRRQLIRRLVIAGLDPAIHPLGKIYPRRIIGLFCRNAIEAMDRRVKPGDDGGG
jgi:hypothetical protein